MLGDKLEELSKRFQRRSTVYEEDRVLIGDIKSEADYIEAQLERLKSNEERLLLLMTTAYQKLEQSGLPKQDPDVKAINKELRGILEVKTMTSPTNNKNTAAVARE